MHGRGEAQNLAFPFNSKPARAKVTMYDYHNILLANRDKDWLEKLRENRAYKKQQAKAPSRPRGLAKPRKPTKLVQSMLDKGLDLATAEAIANAAKVSLKKNA